MIAYYVKIYLHHRRCPAPGSTAEPDARLYFYTDGVIEASNGAELELGLDRLFADIVRYRDRPLRAGLDLIAAVARGR